MESAFSGLPSSTISASISTFITRFNIKLQLHDSDEGAILSYKPILFKQVPRVKKRKEKKKDGGRKRA